MRTMPDGTELQNSTQVNTLRPIDLRYPQTGVIRKLFYKDSDDNPDDKSMMAIVEITSDGNYFESPPVRFASGIKFGTENMFDVTPRASKSSYDSSDYSNKTGDTKRTQETISDGDIVVVQYINGNAYHGIVTNFIAHGEASSDYLPTKSDGERLLLQHQGMRLHIDKFGDLTFESFKSNLSEFKNANPKRTFTVRMKDENGKGCEVIVDNKTNAITLKSEDGKTSTLTLTKDGLSVTGDSTSFGSPTIEFNATTKIDMNSPKVNLGTGASKKVPIGEEVMDFLKTFITLFNAHTHNVPQAPTGTLPSLPPLIPAQKPTPSMLSETVKLKE